MILRMLDAPAPESCRKFHTSAPHSGHKQTGTLTVTHALVYPLVHTRMHTCTNLHTQVQLVLQKADTNLRHWAEDHPERRSPAWGFIALR